MLQNTFEFSATFLPPPRLSLAAAATARAAEDAAAAEAWP